MRRFLRGAYATEAQRFDFGFTFSSLEHDGLGRYGDPISPSAGERDLTPSG